MTIEKFDEFAQLVLANLSNHGKNEVYDTDQNIARDLLDHARSVIFAEELAEQSEYREYLRLKSKFEPVAEPVPEYKILAQTRGDPDWEMDRQRYPTERQENGQQGW